MAKKKPRTPTPPRVQAPQRRGGTSRNKASSPSPDALADRNRLILYAIAAAGFVGIIIVIAVVAFGGGGGGTSDKQVAAAMSAAGCSYKTVTAYVPKGQGTHVNSLTAKLPWNTDPPSNGQHYPEWAVWGFWTEAQNPRRVVHNEEHGGVILWWGPQVPKSTVNKLQAFYNEQPIGSFGTPYAKLGDKIAITAWTGDTAKYQVNNYYGFGHIGICPAFTPKTKLAFETFRNAYRGKGPEGIPLCADEPGDSPNLSSCS